VQYHMERNILKSSRSWMWCTCLQSQYMGGWGWKTASLSEYLYKKFKKKQKTSKTKKKIKLEGTWNFRKFPVSRNFPVNRDHRKHRYKRIINTKIVYIILEFPFHKDFILWFNRISSNHHFLVHIWMAL
jgi:hypothetical protein